MSKTPSVKARSNPVRRAAEHNRKLLKVAWPVIAVMASVFSFWVGSVVVPFHLHELEGPRLTAHSLRASPQVYSDPAAPNGLKLDSRVIVLITNVGRSSISLAGARLVDAPSMEQCGAEPIRIDPTEVVAVVFHSGSNTFQVTEKVRLIHNDGKQEDLVIEKVDQEAAERIYDAHGDEIAAAKMLCAP